jgi:hypothetical protein
VLGVELFAPRAGLSTRQTSVPPRRSASPIAEGLNGLPKRPLRLDFEEPADHCPRFVSRWPGLPNPCDSEPQSQG